MPIQPGLALQLKGAELPDPMAQFAQATQIQNALQQQRMGETQIQNAIDAGKTFAGRTFDIVIFFAALEHMTLDERLTAMKDTWSLLRPGGIWMVVEAPNRLWFWDGHTSMDNFYNWLPDEVASRWAHRGARKAFFHQQIVFLSRKLACVGRGETLS